MTIHELHIQLDLQLENKINILKDVSRKCNEGYLFIDSTAGHCYLFDRNGNEDDIKKLKKIDNALFYNSDISLIIIPGSVESIGDYAFAWCNNLKSIEIPDSFTSIGYKTFIFCKNLESIEIPDSVEWIGKMAFESCESLKSLIFKGKTMKQVKKMENYPFGIEDESIIRCC